MSSLLAYLCQSTQVPQKASVMNLLLEGTPVGYSYTEQMKGRTLWPWEVSGTRSALTRDWRDGRVWSEILGRRGVDVCKTQHW